LFRLANEKTTFTEAFAMADDVLYQGVKGVTDLMVRPGLINLDFADVRAVMDEMGKAMMGTGEASGEDRAIQAAEKAIANPLLDEISLRGAKGVLINITGGGDLTLFELDEAANRIREEVDPDANIIVGSTLDEGMNGTMRVSVVATGIDAAAVAAEVPVPRRRLAEPLPTHAPAPAAAAAPVPQRAPVQQPQPEQAQVRREPAQPVFEPRPAAEPGLFDAAAADAAQPAQAAAEDLPPPAYRPQPAAAQAARDIHVEEEAQSFVAPRPRAPGVPSPEALARLQAAVNRQPAPGTAPQRAQPPVAGYMRPQAAAGAEKPRFGINSLINRMTGHGAAPQPERHVPGVRQQPPAAAAYDDEHDVDPDQERIEIPAFLRRQAN